MADAPPPSSRYRASRGWRWFYVLLGAPFVVLGVAGIVYFASGHEASGRGEQLWMIVVCAAVAFAGVLGAMPALRPTILVLSPGELRARGLLSDRVVARPAIRGWRVIRNKGVDVLVLAVTDRRGPRRVRIDLLFARDAQFALWFAGIPDLDDAERADAVREAEADSRLGRTPDERLATAARARRIAVLCRRAAYVSCLWFALWPVPYALLFTAVAAWPWIAFGLCWKYRGAFAIDNPGRNAVRGDLTPMLVLPAGVLALRVLVDSHLSIVGPVFAPAFALGCAIVWLARAHGTAWRRWRMFVVLVMLALAYAPSTIAIADQVFDAGAPTPLRVTVLGKRATTGKGATHYLRVAPWGLRRRPNEIEVKRDLYDRVAAGNAVCVLVHPGALGMPWYEVQASGC